MQAVYKVLEVCVSSMPSASCAEGCFWLLLEMTVFGALEEGGGGGRERGREGIERDDNYNIIAERKGRREGVSSARRQGRCCYGCSGRAGTTASTPPQVAS